MAGLLDDKRWEVLESDEDTERMLSDTLGISRLVARVLVARGITEVGQAREFITPSLERDWEDPLDIPGMAEAADRVERAIRDRETIAVFGDFDVDGMTSTCLLTQALRTFGATCDPYIPHRFGEGYGLSREALDRVIAGTSPDLIITVDNGIAAGEEVEWLLSQGIDVVVTDHHEPGDLVPKGVPVTDPKLMPDCSSRELAGAGVALKLVCELGRRLGKPDLWWDFTDLAALGTVSDMMLLTGENRSLVADGIERMRASHRPGIVSLAASANVDLFAITADSLPFSLIPRLNAAGRMGTTDVAFDLLISDDMGEAATLAGMLEHTNTERRDTESLLSEEALATIERTYEGQRVIVVAGNGWHEGVKGIVASRIVSRYHVPAIVFSINGDVARGSGRSVGSVDLFHAVEQCSDLLVRFGGHAGAVGVTCAADRIDAFRSRIEGVMAALPVEQFQDLGEVAAIAELSELTREGIADLEVLQPFGQGNKRPLLGIRSVFMKARSRVGYDGNHLRFTASDGVSALPAIMFRTPDMQRAYACDEVVDLVVDAVNETWQGRTQPKLMVRDIIYHEDGIQGEKRLADTLLAIKQPSLSDVTVSTTAVRVALTALPELELNERLIELVTHGIVPTETENEVLERLARGRHTVIVDSLTSLRCAYLHAAKVAIMGQMTSVFVYATPSRARCECERLRALLGRAGLVVELLADDATCADVLERHASGACDVLVTTPSALASSAQDLRACGLVDFVVWADLTELTGEGGELPDDLLPLGEGVVTLGVIAFDEPGRIAACAKLLSLASDDILCLERTGRRPVVVDRRGATEREELLASIVSRGSSTLVCAGSWDEAVHLVEGLVRNAPDLRGRIAPYSARLRGELMDRVRTSFADKTLTCVVCDGMPGASLMACGVHDVVVFAMPRGVAQLAREVGLAGSDGHAASVHLLFGSVEAYDVERELAARAPERRELVALYRALRAEERASGAIRLDDEELLDRMLALDATVNATPDTAVVGVAIFGELGFLKVVDDKRGRTIEMVESPGHMDLDRSITYVQARRAHDAFARFSAWVLSASPAELAGLA